MLPKEDRKAMLLRLYNEDTPLMDHSKDRFHDKPPSSSALLSDKSVKHGPDDVKDEEEGEEADAVVMGEIVVKGEGEEDGVAAAGLGEDVEAMADGARDGEREDDVLPGSLEGEMEESEDGA